MPERVVRKPRENIPYGVANTGRLPVVRVARYLLPHEREWLSGLSARTQKWIEAVHAAARRHHREERAREHHR